MTLKAGDIPTWMDLSQKFLGQYRFCAETPLTLLDLSMTEMREGQAFEVYATEWRGKATKHISPITERQQVQPFHSTLRGAYYSYLLAHTSSFSDLIEAGKKLDMGIKLGRIEGPSRKKDRETSKKQTVGTSKRSKDATIGAVNSGHQALQPISVDYTPALQTAQAYAHPVHYVQPYQTSQACSPTPPTVIQSQSPQQYYPVRAQQGRPRLRDLLSRLNVLQPTELNRAMLFHRVSASSIPLYQLVPPTYSGSFLLAIRSK
ncbi:hypothetical protein CRG98_024187 [Punica granatum]|uniref:Retrotransposon gag domain-containing protein n=1 Tax=Punica granatum TaxID=22663 RepID=A0A2I0JGM8_PUNGR|nr:hypothetical protein CRG98_024187 [Punica granatum]